MCAKQQEDRHQSDQPTPSVADGSTRGAAENPTTDPPECHRRARGDHRCPHGLIAERAGPRGHRLQEEHRQCAREHRTGCREWQHAHPQHRHPAQERDGEQQHRNRRRPEDEEGLAQCLRGGTVELADSSSLSDWGRTPSLFETVAEIDLRPQESNPRKPDSDIRLKAVLEITRYLRSTLEPDEVLSRIVDCVTHMFPQYSRSQLFRHDTTTGEPSAPMPRFRNHGHQLIAIDDAGLLVDDDNAIRITIEGDASALLTIFGNMETFTPGFAIVEP